MSRAEELAKELLEVIDGPAFHVPHYMARQAAAELRRLAQVEAEHAALLKAISDAEPVAWYAPAIDGRSMARFDGRPMLMVGAVGNEIHTAPLYTLNGIKKP